MKKYLPLVLVETYLVFTLLLYVFGPIQFRGHNTDLFVMVMFIYHGAFILGYYLAIKTYKFNKIIIDTKFSSQRFYFALFFAVISLLLTYQNALLAESFIPYNLFEDLARGIREPDVVYLERMNAGATVIAGAQIGTRTVNIFSIFFSFFKLLFIFLSLYFWNDLSYFKKFLVLMYAFLFLSAGIASGTNSIIFIFFIFTTLSLLVLAFIRSTRNFIKLLPFMGVIFLIPIGFFGFLMSRRGGGFEYFAGSSSFGDITAPASTPYLTSFFDFYYYTFVWLNYYLVQGYYGFSLILNLDQNWTFGFGNSDFLQRQLLLLTGTDVSDLTFQAQISQYWGPAQWHSFYGQFANDFGFAGLSVLMFILGFFLSRVWASVIYNNSFYGMSLLPIFSLMFIFFPANNQVFGYIDTLSYSLCMSLFWFFENKTVRFLK
jgi:hypothetical protein